MLEDVLARSLAEGDVDTAIDHYRELREKLEFFPESSIGHYSKGELHVQRGELASAIQAMEKAVALQPGNPRLEKRLAELRQQLTSESATRGVPESSN